MAGTAATRCTPTRLVLAFACCFVLVFLLAEGPETPTTPHTAAGSVSHGTSVASLAADASLSGPVASRAPGVRHQHDAQLRASQAAPSTAPERDDDDGGGDEGAASEAPQQSESVGADDDTTAEPAPADAAPPPAAGAARDPVPSPRLRASTRPGAKRGSRVLGGWSWMSLPSSTLNRAAGPWMDPLEVAMLRLFLDPSISMLEYGSGRSTRYFSKFVGRYTSIEDKEEWCDTVRGDLLGDGLTHVELACVPKATPERTTREVDWYDYGHHVERCCAAFKAANVDILLNDGSARALINRVALEMVLPTTLFALHDYHRGLQDGYFYAVKRTYVVLRTFMSVQPGKGQIALRRKSTGTLPVDDDLFGVGDFGRGPRPGEAAGAVRGDYKPLAPGWNVYSVAADLRCLADAHNTVRLGLRPLDVALLRTFLWPNREGEATLRPQAVVQFGASVSSLYLAQLAAHVAVIEWRTPMCQWLRTAAEAAGARLAGLQVVCVDPRRHASTGDALTAAFDACCDAFTARQARLAVVSDLEEEVSTRRAVLSHLARTVAPPASFVAATAWGVDQHDSSLVRRGLSRVVGAGKTPTPMSGGRGGDNFGLMVLAVGDYNKRTHKGLARLEVEAPADGASGPGAGGGAWCPAAQ